MQITGISFGGEAFRHTFKKYNLSKLLPTELLEKIGLTL